jgi:pantoate--beta-alanine ligase
MEGSYRPGHFEGVVMVLHRFLNIIQPDAIYMGQKDYQQYLITDKLARDFHPTTKVRKVQTAREEDGLAMSSRNLRLGESGRIASKKLIIALKEFAHQIKENDLKQVRQNIIEELNEDPIIEVEYLELADAKTMALLNNANQNGEKVVCIAAKVEEVRLIDNLIIS